MHGFRKIELITVSMQTLCHIFLAAASAQQ